MRFLIYVAQPLALIAAAARWEAVADTLVALFIAGSAAVVFYSIARHIRSNNLSRQP